MGLSAVMGCGRVCGFHEVMGLDGMSSDGVSDGVFQKFAQTEGLTDLILERFPNRPLLPFSNSTIFYFILLLLFFICNSNGMGLFSFWE